MPRALFWVDAAYPEIGGLEKRVDALATSMTESGSDVLVVTTSGQTIRRNGYQQVAEGHFARSAALCRDRILQGCDLFYVCRLFSGMEVEHSFVMASLDKLVPVSILRLQSTRAARIVVRETVRDALERSAVRFHALNPESRALVETVYPNRSALVPNPFPQPLPFRDVDTRQDACFVGRIVPSKGLFELIQAWLSVRTNEHLDVYGIGTGPYAAICLELIDNTPRVSYRGPMPVSNWSMLERYRFLILPSFREGHSNILTEAMACWTPVIGRRIPGIQEHLEAGNGVLFDESGADLIVTLERSLSLNQEDWMSISRASGSYAAANTNDAQLTDIMDSVYHSHTKRTES